MTDNNQASRFLQNSLSFCVGVTLALGTVLYTKDEPKVVNVDLNNDGRVDSEVISKRGRNDIYFIQREDGTFDRCNLLVRDGYPFYKTLDGKLTYSPDGAVFDNVDFSKSYNLTKVVVNEVTNVLPREPFYGKTVTNSWTKSREYFRNKK